MYLIKYKSFNIKWKPFNSAHTHTNKWSCNKDTQFVENRIIFSNNLKKMEGFRYCQCVAKYNIK